MRAIEVFFEFIVHTIVKIFWFILSSTCFALFITMIARFDTVQNISDETELFIACLLMAIVLVTALWSIAKLCGIGHSHGRVDRAVTGSLVEPIKVKER